MYDLMDEALHYFQHIHEVVLKEKDSSPNSDIMELSAGILKGLGLPETALIPIVVRSFEAHLNVSSYLNLLQI